MIITKYVSVKVSTKTLKKYKSILKKDLKVKDIITIEPKYLTKGSHVVIKTCCDNCMKEKDIEFKSYYNYTNGLKNKYYCKKCSSIKIKENNLEKYGYEHTFQIPSVKNKIKNTFILKYGYDNPLKNKSILNKVENTNIGKYGSKSPMKNEHIKNKMVQTINSYNSIKKEEIKNKRYQTSFKKWGNISNLCLLEHKNRIKKTNIEKYGFEYPTMNEIIKNKIKNKNRILIKNHYKILFEKEKYKDYTFLNYNNDTTINLLHNKCNKEFILNKNTFYSTHNICPYCYNSSSLKELDIYIPSLNIAIEFNGLYWHSELYKDKDYHLKKTIECKEKGIQLLHIWEDDWNYKQNIIKSIIRNRLNKIDSIIYARKCEIKEVKSNIVREFLDENHIQGFSRSTYKLGLYYKGELVSIMTFGYRKTNSKKEFELIRFCNKIDTNIIGASSKLFKYFLNHYKIEDSYIISYSDISLFDGNMYKQKGFKEIHTTKPNYYWIINGRKEHRWKFNKQKLISEGFSKDKTEVEIMHERGYYRLFSCGQKRYEYTIK